MMRHGPEFEAERKAIAEQVLLMVHESFTYPHVRRALGALAADLEEVAHMVVVADVADGRILEYDGYRDSDTFPLLMARVREPLIHTMIEEMPFQSEVSRGVSHLWLDTDVSSQPLEDASTLSTTGVLTSSLMGAGGMTQEWIVKETSDGVQEYVLKGRPLILLRRAHRQNMELIAFHEISHAHDAIVSPVFERSTFQDGLFESELKAYAVGNAVGTALYGKAAMKAVDPITFSVENVRRRHNGSRHGYNAFSPDDRIKSTLERIGLASVYR